MGPWPASGKSIYRLSTLGAPMGSEAEKGIEIRVSQPWKALWIALAFNLAGLLLIFVLPLVWPVVILSIIPSLGARLGGRYVERGTAIKIGIVSALVLVTLLVYILLSILASINPQNFDLFESLGFSLIVVGYLVAIVFGALGGRHSATRIEEA